jgi:hypothetical protein
MSDDGYVFESSVARIRAVSEVAADVRWHDGRLQQRWRVTEYENGQPVSVEEEWRDVPQTFSASIKENPGG